MAEINSTATESRAGAIACLNALRIIERINDGGYNPDSTPADHWHDIDAAQAAMIHAAGARDGFIAGFISVFAEYAHLIASAGVPDLYVWKPEATMSEEEKAKSRIEFDERLAAEA